MSWDVWTARDASVLSSSVKSKVQISAAIYTIITSTVTHIYTHLDFSFLQRPADQNNYRPHQIDGSKAVKIWRKHHLLNHLYLQARSLDSSIYTCVRATYIYTFLTLANRNILCHSSSAWATIHANKPTAVIGLTYIETWHTGKSRYLIRPAPRVSLSAC